MVEPKNRKRAILYTVYSTVLALYIKNRLFIRQIQLYDRFPCGQIPLIACKQEPRSRVDNHFTKKYEDSKLLDFINVD